LNAFDLGPPRSPSAWSLVDWAGHTRTVQTTHTSVNVVDIGEGPPVVLLHGLGGCWQTWLENIEALAQQHRVLAVDLPGFGSSPALPAPFEFTLLVDIVAEVLERCEAPAATLVGHSLGGLIALVLAESRPELVASLALVSGGGVELGRARLSALMRSFRVLDLVLSRPGMPDRIARTPAMRRAMVRVAVADPRALSEQLARQIIPPMNAPGFVATAMAGARFVRTAPAPSPRCPTLLLWGRQDRILPLRTAEALERRLPSAELQVIDGAGHCAMFEQPTAVNDRLLAFLRQQRPGDPARP
jgi:pimeloyl-ACP methyl ester carboxylesterase